MLLQSLEGHSLSQFLNHRSERYKLIIAVSILPPDAPQMWDLNTSGPSGSFFFFFDAIKFEPTVFSEERSS